MKNNLLPLAKTSHSSQQGQLIDRFQRHIHYLRLSVTDRCDFRCQYCMPRDVKFLPRGEILSLEELYTVARVFVELGVKKIRLTGGEPLIRKGIVELSQQLVALPGLQELTLTTNGSQLAQYAEGLRQAGVKRVNISLDSLVPERFRQMTLTGSLAKVMEGIDAAASVGFDNIRINSVIMKRSNDDEIADLLDFAIARQFDIAFIEEMPLGNMAGRDRLLEFCSSDELRHRISTIYQLVATNHLSGGPARYYQIAGTTTRVGFISPHSNNFCPSCNRVRVTAEGRLLLCLGHEHSVDLKSVLRQNPQDYQRLRSTIQNAMMIKPERHYFDLNTAPNILRFMSHTGG